MSEMADNPKPLDLGGVPEGEDVSDTLAAILRGEPDHLWWLACSRPAFPDAARPAWIIHASDRRRADLASR